MIEFCIQFDYSGGPGLNSGYCRQTSVHFVIEVSPSVLITHWDVLSAEQLSTLGRPLKTALIDLHF